MVRVPSRSDKMMQYLEEIIKKVYRGKVIFSILTAWFNMPTETLRTPIPDESEAPPFPTEDVLRFGAFRCWTDPLLLGTGL